MVALIGQSWNRRGPSFDINLTSLNRALAILIRNPSINLFAYRVQTAPLSDRPLANQ